ncbi:cupin [Brucella anthropi]|uniref:cupin domain-containing protein n=1 Tax=Brucella anthropi TaxID=529 RepID=UPI003987A56B
MSNRIINLDEIELHSLPAGIAATGEAARHYAPKIAMVGLQLGARKLAYNVIALEPGKKAFPFHSHRTNEELFLVLEGSGEIRIGQDCFSIRKGDVIACPAGGAETAHQIINSGETELRYLALSTKFPTDIIEYPDSGKYRVQAEAEGDASAFDAINRFENCVGYWDGE